MGLVVNRKFNVSEDGMDVHFQTNKVCSRSNFEPKFCTDREVWINETNDIL
jgi:hypothetical protein